MTPVYRSRLKINASEAFFMTFIAENPANQMVQTNMKREK